MNNFSYILLTTIVASSSLFAQSIEDFNFPVTTSDRNPTEAEQLRTVKHPSEIRSPQNSDLDNEIVVSGASTQDAINHAQQDLINTKKNVRFISTPNGVGVIAVGYGDYVTQSDNLNFMLIEQRQAYINATIRAKEAMAGFLNGLTINAKNELTEQTETVTTSNLDIVMNSKEYSSEVIQRCINAYLCGVVVYDIQDDPENGEVTVSMITTPKTQGAIQTLPKGNLTASSLEEGLEEILNQIRYSLVPPGGGRIVTVPSTGKVAWVGFGSAINSKTGDRASDRKLMRAAEQKAKLRADKNLLAIINGEEIYSNSLLESKFVNEIRMFDTVPGVDGENEVQRKSQKETNAYQEELLTEVFGTSTIGSLPSGLQHISKTSKDGNWSFAVVIFSADATVNAEALKSRMDKLSPLTSVKRTLSRTPNGSYKKDEDGNFVLESMGNARISDY